MFSGIAINVSGLNAFGKKMAVIANNVANVNSEKFEKSRVILKEGDNGNVSVDILKTKTIENSVAAKKDDKSVNNQASNVNLVEEFTQSIITKRCYQANVTSIRTQDEMLGYLLDIKQ